MMIYRSAKALITQIPRKARGFVTATVTAAAGATTTSSVISQPSPAFLLGHNRTPSSPISRWIGPLHGPLFLSFPPWKLSQSATPLWGNRVVLRRVQALNLELIRRRSKFPGFGSVLSDFPTSGRVVKEEDRPLETEGFLYSFVNVPNLISMSRLVSGPFLGWMIVNEMYSYAFVGLAVSGLTDWLDGYMARKMRIDSVVGSYLDPLADKVLIGCVALAMVHNDLLHPGIVGTVVLRDVALVSGAVYLRARSLDWQWKHWSDFFNLDGAGRQKVEPLFISKVNTVFQLVLVAAALLQPEFGTPETQPFITYLSWVVAATTVASTIAYGAQNMRKRPALGATKS